MDAYLLSGLCSERGGTSMQGSVAFSIETILVLDFTPGEDEML